jgi:hypothetical protein
VCARIISWHNPMRIDMPSINEQQDPRDAARAIIRESEELKSLLEKELLRLETNETFSATEFQNGAIRALIDLFRMVDGLASILIAQSSHDDQKRPDSHVAA